ncbi:MAG TPA: ABC transporter ATP-binding protein [Verrucomicrobia bacterium]|nr:ABC transporter ATP-binding protein [Verrucomicrobiales bacterium]HIL55011.1 ABC transporter ATP-binding protein [Verrucomicrobiota bacterium]
MNNTVSEVTLRADGITKSYSSESGLIRVLNHINLELSHGDFITISGPSGCGKSTLLAVLGALQEPDSGTVEYDGISPYRLSAKDRAQFRSKNIGFVFQDFNLVPYLTVRENILCPGIVNSSNDWGTRTAELIESLGLSDRSNHYPDQLSSGEKQRTALARALLVEPTIIFADEPTGNLDQENGQRVLDHLTSYANDGATVMMATHDMDAFNTGNKHLQMDEGSILTLINDNGNN